MENMRKFWFCVYIFSAACGLLLVKVLPAEIWEKIATGILWGFIIGNSIEYLPDLLNKNKPA